MLLIVELFRSDLLDIEVPVVVPDGYWQVALEACEKLLPPVASVSLHVVANEAKSLICVELLLQLRHVLDTP